MAHLVLRREDYKLFATDFDGNGNDYNHNNCDIVESYYDATDTADLDGDFAADLDCHIDGHNDLAAGDHAADCPTAHIAVRIATCISADDASEGGTKLFNNDLAIVTSSIFIGNQTIAADK